MLSERQKLILLANKSHFGWKTVEQYTQHELADNEEDGKKIRRAEERAKKALKFTISTNLHLRRPACSSRFSSQYSRSSSSVGSFRNQHDRLSYPRPPDVPSRPGILFRLRQVWPFGGPNAHSNFQGVVLTPKMELKI